MSLTPKQQALRLFEQALQLTPDDRARFLDVACHGDASLREHVEALLADVDEDDSSTRAASPSLSTDDAAGEETSASPHRSYSLPMGFKIQGRYTITGTLGAGGMGEVYRAADPLLDREVAIKALSAWGLRDQEMRERFDREMKAVASLSHPNIVTLYDLAQDNERVFAVMELVEGRTLRELIDEGIAWREALELTREIAAGLAAAHQRNLMHRDIKPENVIRTAAGHAKILDFGLARRGALPTEQLLTGPSLTPGTIPYMSPEQAEGRELTCATDLFSLGTVLFEMLTGVNPFRGETPLETLKRVSKAQPPKIADFVNGTPEAAVSLVTALLDPDPNRRPTADQVATESPSIAVSYDASPAKPTRKTGSGFSAVDSTTPTNLPLRSADLTGRDREMQNLLERLDKSALLTVCGPGGVGKTSLAYEAARHAMGSFPGGVWLCELSSLRRPEQVAEAIAAVLDGAAGSTSGLDEIVARLQGEATLLLFDNCEHVIDAVAELAETLLEKLPNLTILVTSRESLSTTGEYVLRLEGLEQADAMALFIARAAAQSDYQDDSQFDRLTKQIVEQLEGLPLAIELAAPRLATMSLGELCDALSDQMETLQAGRRSRGRQGTIDRTIAWSFDLLEEGEQQTLLALSVFVASFTAEAAEVVCGGGRGAKRRLQRLVEQSVVTRKERGGRSRYRLLEPIRQFCRTRIDDAERQAARERHARYFASRAADTLSLGVSGYDEADCLVALNAEWADLRKAVAWGREHGVADVAIKPCVALTRTAFWQLRLELFDWLNAVEDSMGDCFADDASALASLGWGCWLRGQKEEADAYLQRLEAIPPTPFSLWSIAYLTSLADDHHKSVEYWRRFEQLAEEVGSEVERRWVRCAARAHPHLLVDDESHRVDELLAIAEHQAKEAGWLTGKALYYGTRMVVALHRANPLEARRMAAHGIETARRAGNRFLELGLGAVYVGMSTAAEGDDPAQSLSKAIDACRDLLEANDRSLLPIATRGLVIALEGCGEAGAAAKGSALAERLVGAGDKNQFTPEYPNTLDRLREQLGAEQFDQLRKEGGRLSVGEFLDIGQELAVKHDVEA